MKFYNILNKADSDESGSKEFEDQVAKLKKLNLKYDILSAAYYYVTERYTSSRLEFFLKLPMLPVNSFRDLTSRKGFMFCTNQNAVLTALLLKSGRFQSRDIKKRWTLYFGLTPHQYLKVKTEDGWIDVDPWSSDYGLAIGDYARGLHIGSIRRQKK
jgi:hypothetical protein